MRNTGIKVDATRARYPTSKRAIEIAELEPADPSERPPFVWIDGILTKNEAEEYEPHQICGKIPGMDIMCYKSNLFSALNDMRKYYPYQFNVYPRTYQLPKDFLEFQRDHMSVCGKTGVAPTWIVKPKSGCCGHGITIVQSTHEAQKITYQAVIQQYVRPFLINNRKFDFRLYLLIGSLEPLNLYIYKEGIARFCSEDFQMPTKANRDDKFIHLTNTAINVENGEADASVFTKKASEVFDKIDAQYHNREKLWERICECSRAVVVSLLPKLLTNLPKKRRQFKISYGVRPEVLPEMDLCEDGPVQGVSETLEPIVEKTKLSSPHRLVPSNILVIPKANDSHPNPLIPHYKLTQLTSTGPVLSRRYEFTSRARYSLAPKKTTASPFSKHHIPGIRSSQRLANSISSKNREEESEADEDQIESESETIDENETQISDQYFSEELEKGRNKDKEKPKSKPVKVGKRYFHVLGIDIILDSNLEPQVLELNDRPSLSVTVPFEKELKEGLLSEAFQHISPTGQCYGDCEGSGWHQIFPLPTGELGSATWNEIYTKAAHPKLNGELDCVPVVHRERQIDQPIFKQKKPKRKKKGKKSKRGKKDI